MALTAADGSVPGGRRSTDRESGGRRSVSLPSRYLEELESVSSPGVVSKKAAYFEEAIRFASGEKCGPSSSGKAGGITMTQLDESLADGDSTVRTLQFCWDSEEPPASKNTEQLDETAQEHSGESPGAAEGSSGAEKEIPPPQLCDSPEVEKRELSDDKSSQSNDTDLANGELLKENQDPRSEDNDSGKATSKGTAPKLRECCQKASVSEKPAASSTPCHPKARAKGGSLRSSCSGVPGTVARLSNTLARSTNFTKPQPFALSTEKRRQTGTSTSKMASGRSEKVVRQNGEEFRHGPSVHKQEAYPARSLAGRGTNAKAFVLKSDERAEKRKEFYTKLEERMAAREQEKNQLKAKSQDEKEAEIRRLRQSLTFKATPIPSFYHTGMEQRRAERKKSPAMLTRPVSPKLGRQKRGEAAKQSRPCQQCQSPVQTPPGAKVTSSSSSASSKVSDRASKASPSSSPEALELSDGCSVFLKEEDEAILLPGSV